jgi:hypothetical protein
VGELFRGGDIGGMDLGAKLPNVRDAFDNLELQRSQIVECNTAFDNFAQNWNKIIEC